MKVFRLIISLVVFVAWIYIIGNSHKIGSLSIPPLGKFMDPFQGFFQNGESRDLDLSGTFEIEGLSAPVSIRYDSNQIPHIYAQNNKDLYIAQGYLVASYRLWQMDIQTRSASGRISEVMGPLTLNIDKLTRRKGMVWGSDKINEFIKKDYPEVWSSFESYTLGVNSYINSLNYSNYPIEFKLLD